MPGKREYGYCLTDTTLVGKLKLDGECDQGVDISYTEGGGLAEDVQNGEMSGQETKEDEHEAEVEQPTGQSQRPVRIRKPPNRYGELISKLPTADVRGQGGNKDTENKIAEEGKNTAGKLFILSVR